MKKPKQIDISQEEITEIQNLLEKSLNKETYEKTKVLIELLIYLIEALKGSKASIRKLMKLIFGWKTEKSPQNRDKEKEEVKPKENPPPKGHGKNGSSAYTGADREVIPHESLKHGDRCPTCSKGKVYGLKEPCPIIRVTGNAPLQATVY
jgi:transposase